MKIFVTGIAGFLGSHLANALVDQGHEVCGNDNLICGDKENVPVERLCDTIKYTDCRNYDEMKKNLKGYDCLIHCAATAHEGLSSFSPHYITTNIYDASVATFSAAIANRVKRIIYMSSMARYGRQSLPFHEDMTPKPVDPYGVSKVAAEDTLRILANTHNTEYVIAIPHNIIGIFQRYCDPYRNVASIMINRALQGKPILIYGNGQQKRCFSPIQDCLQCLVRMVDAPISGQRINIGPDEGEITILELADMIRGLTGNLSQYIFMPDRPNEVKAAYCSSDKARRLLGYEPKGNVRECLSDMVDYIRYKGTKEFEYRFPIEIEKGCPRTWVEKLI